jgi:hypothetical protein
MVGARGFEPPTPCTPSTTCGCGRKAARRPQGAQNTRFEQASTCLIGLKNLINLTRNGVKQGVSGSKRVKAKRPMGGVGVGVKVRLELDAPAIHQGDPCSHATATSHGAERPSDQRSSKLSSNRQATAGPVIGDANAPYGHHARLKGHTPTDYQATPPPPVVDPAQNGR